MRQKQPRPQTVTVIVTSEVGCGVCEGDTSGIKRLAWRPGSFELVSVLRAFLVLSRDLKSEHAQTGADRGGGGTTGEWTTHSPALADRRKVAYLANYIAILYFLVSFGHHI